MTAKEIQRNIYEHELKQYIGPPYCIDCHWKPGSPLTDNCDCRKALFKESPDPVLFQKHFERARFLQEKIKELS